MNSLLLAVRAVVVATGFFVLWAWVALGVEGLDRRLQARLPDWTAVPGLVVMTIGAALAVSCIAIFVAVGRGTPAPFDAPRRFVAVGPYRYVRNPMYVGGSLILAGWGLYRHSPSVLLLTALWLGLAHLFVLAYEEPALRRAFGVDYARYLETVPRWIRVRRRRHGPGDRSIPQARPAAVLLAIGLGVTASTAADRPDLTCVWTMNRGRSEFGLLPGPDSRTDRIEHREPSLKVSRTQVTGGAEAGVEWACTTDGAECVNTVRGNALRSTARWDGDALLVESRGKIQDEEVKIQERWTLSSDRKTLTLQRHLAADRGETDQTIVLERQ